MVARPLVGWGFVSLFCLMASKESQNDRTIDTDTDSPCASSYAFVNCISARMTSDKHHIQTVLAHFVDIVVVVVAVVLIAVSVVPMVPVVPVAVAAPAHSHSLPRSFEYVHCCCCYCIRSLQLQWEIEAAVVVAVAAAVGMEGVTVMVALHMNALFCYRGKSSESIKLQSDLWLRYDANAKTHTENV